MALVFDPFESFSSCLTLLSLEEFWKALARLPEHDLESDDTIPYIIRHELAAHEPRLAELSEETPRSSFVALEKPTRRLDVG